MENIFDAIIIGAGPAGSSAAILLAGAGWSVALIEKQVYPRRKVCGECIAASNLPLLRALGVGPAFDRTAGAELRNVAFMKGAETVIARLPAAKHADHAWGRALGREKLDTLMLERARSIGVTVFQPWSLESIAGGPGAWHCVIKSNTLPSQPLFAPILIDAHGSWEKLPSDRVQQGRPRLGVDLLAFKANFVGTDLDEGVLPVLAFAGGYGGMVVADGGITTLACCVRRDRLGMLRRTDRGISAGKTVEAMLERECAGVRKALARATISNAWLAAGPLNPGIRVHTDDGLFRIGNAAGEAHPIIGEGMSMALQSAWLLSAELLGVNGADRRQTINNTVSQKAARRRYAANWHRRFAPRIRLASAFAHASMDQRGANVLLMLLKAWPGFLPLGATWVGKTRCAINDASIALAAGRYDS
jgi:2-polyprenyl-6-methoxyphenol hydroxylase-like FAD-dependent oxidoreductase